MTGSQISRSEMAERRAAAFASGLVLAIADVPIWVRGEDIQRASALSSLLYGFAPSTESPVATLRFGSRPPKLPGRPPDESYHDLRVWRSEQILYLAHGSGVTARVDPTEIVAGGDGDLGRAVRRLFLPAIAHLLGHRGRWVLHGALISIRRQGVVALGATGRGKSTLAGAAWTSGWSVHTDDIVVLRSAGGVVDACGLPRPPAVPLDALPAELVGSGPVDARGRVEIDPETLDRGWATVAGLVLVGHGSGPRARLEPLPGPLAVRSLVGSFPSAANPALVRPYLRVAAKVGSLPSWLLYQSDDPRDRLAEACRMLDVVARLLAGDRG